MKIYTFILALPLLGISGFATAHSQQERTFKPQPAIVERVMHHGVNQYSNSKAPVAQSQKKPQQLPQQTPIQQHIRTKRMLSQVMAVSCDLNALAVANPVTIIDEVKRQGARCINELFAATDLQPQIFTTDNMIAVANHANSLSQSYTGGGNEQIEALFLYLRTGFYAEFYNDSIDFPALVTPSVADAIDAFVNNQHFYDNNDDHGKTLSEVIITMDSAEQQHRYLEVVKQWLTRFDKSYASSWNMRNAVNGIFTLLYRGQWNEEFVTLIANDKALVIKLSEFTQKQWLIGSDGEFLIVNAASELARLKKYSKASIQPDVDAGLTNIFNTYQSYGYGDAVWLGAADIVNYYTDCSKFGVCNFVDTLTQQVLSQQYNCSNTIKIRSQAMTAAQHAAACDAMQAEEGLFHTKLATENMPVADDYNRFLYVNIFDSSDDYSKYAKAIFGINTNNGGMYLEGDPSDTDNEANFVAYEASYAKADHFVWNLEHEYVHYLDGRFNLYGNFNSPTEDIVWWSEGVAEYIANQNDNEAAINTIKNGQRFTLQQIFATNYDGFDQDRIYRWGYLGVRFMFERYKEQLNTMLTDTRRGNWRAYKNKTQQWANNYENEFVQWCDQLVYSSPLNIAPSANINGPYSGLENTPITFSSVGSSDSDGNIVIYTWLFGDGISSTDANPTHTYTQSGQYTVSLTVTDNDGDIDVKTIIATVTENTQGNKQTLINGQPLFISQKQNTQLQFNFDVPFGASELTFSLNDGSGDADLYVSYNLEPTLSHYDCRPYLEGNNEQCIFNPARVGSYHVMVNGYNNYDNVKLTASYKETHSSLPDACATSSGQSKGRLKDGEVICLSNSGPMWFAIADVNSQSGISITSANGSGNIDLSYSNSTWPNGSNEIANSANSANNECIFIRDQEQFWGYLKVSGNSEGASLVVDFNSTGCR